MPYQCKGLCERYCKNGTVTKGHRSLYDVGFFRCSICNTFLTIQYIKKDSSCRNYCLCCGCKVRANPRGKYRKITPTIKMIHSNKLKNRQIL